MLWPERKRTHGVSQSRLDFKMRILSSVRGILTGEAPETCFAIHVCRDQFLNGILHSLLSAFLFASEQAGPW